MSFIGIGRLIAKLPKNAKESRYSASKTLPFLVGAKYGNSMALIG